MKSLGIDTKGYSATLSNDHNVTELGKIIELTDNSKKAECTEINIINNNDYFVIKDNGIGFSKRNIPDIMKCQKRHEDNENSLSQYGIGLKKSLYGKLINDKSFGFIISVMNSEFGSGQVCFIYMKIINGELKYDTADLHPTIQEQLKSIISSGTIIFIEHESDLSFDPNSPDETIIFHYVCDFIKRYSDKSYTLVETDPKLYEDICKIYAPTLNENFKIIYNDKECIPDHFIDEENDKKILDIELYIDKSTKYHRAVLKDFNIQFDFDKNDGVYAVEKSDIDFNNDINVIKICDMSVYESKPDDLNKRIQINIPNNRVLQRNKFPHLKGFGIHLYKYIRVNIDFVNLQYLREYILVEQKLPNNVFSVDDSIKKMKCLNNVITKICMNDTILQHYGWSIQYNIHKKINSHCEGCSELVTDCTCQQEIHLKPGGHLYLITLKDSDDWSIDGKIICKFGKCGRKDLNDRIKEHGRHHPTKKIDILWRGEVEHGLDDKEKEIIAKFQELGYRLKTRATSRSEFVLCSDYNEIISVIKGIIPS